MASACAWTGAATQVVAPTFRAGARARVSAVRPPVAGARASFGRRSRLARLASGARAGSVGPSDRAASRIARAASPDAPPSSSDLPTPAADELVLVVGGAGRVGARVVRRLAAMGVRVRVMTRDVHSPVAAELAALGAEIVPGDVTDPDPAPLARAVAGCTRVVACFGAQRISKISDLFAKPHETDPTHPAAVNHRGVRALVDAAVAAGTVRRFVRVTGMSVGYPPAHIIAVMLNAVLSMTIRWQRLGETAIRESGLEYATIRPGNLLDEPRPDGAVVLVGHGGAHVPAGKVSRDDVAECVVCGTFAPNAANATVGVAGSFKPTGGVTTEMSWDPARGMHYRAVEVDANVMEGTDVAEMMTKVGPDDDILERKTYEPFVAAFYALVAGVAVAGVSALVALARWVVAAAA